MVAHFIYSENIQEQRKIRISQLIQNVQYIHIGKFVFVSAHVHFCYIKRVTFDVQSVLRQQAKSQESSLDEKNRKAARQQDRKDRMAARQEGSKTGRQQDRKTARQQDIENCLF